MEKTITFLRLGFAFSMICVLAAITVGVTVTAVSNYDIWWHLKTGEYILDSRHVPTTDPFSFTRHGEPWVTHEWLSDVFLYAADHLFGITGLVILKLVIIMAILAIMYKTAKLSTSRPMLILVVLPVMLFLSRHRFFVRPHLISLLLFTCELWLLEAVWNKKITPKWLWLLPPLFLIWVNAHGGFVYGIALVGLYCGCVWIARRRTPLTAPVKSIRQFIVPGLAASAICMLNPNGIAVFTYGLTIYQEGYVASNMEWFSPFDPSMRRHTMVYIFSAYLLVVTAVLFVARRFVSFKDICIAGLFGLLSIKSQRNIPYFAIATVPMLIRYLESLIRHRISKYTNRNVLFQCVKLIALVVYAVVAVRIFTIGYPIAIAGQGSAKPGLGIDTAALPVAAVAFAKKHGITGNYFNSYQFGGYLIYAGYPDIRVFIDGRADVFGPQLYERYRKSLVYPGYFTRFEQQFDFDAALLSYETEDELLHRYLWKNPGWHLVYFDDTALLYVRDTDEFAHLIEYYAYTAVHPLFDVSADQSEEHHIIGQIVEYRRALEQNPYTGSVYVKLSRLYRTMGKFSEAESVLKTGIKNCGATYPLLNQLGLVYLRQKQYSHAEKLFRQAIRQNRYLPDAYGNLAVAYYEMGMLQKSAKNFKKVLSVNPSDSFARSMLKQIGQQLSGR